MFYIRDDSSAEDRGFFQEALQRLPRLFRRMIATDNVILFDRNLGYQNDRNFVRAFFKTATSAQDKTLELRLNTLAWAASHALYVPGDFVECGVYEGFSSFFLAEYLDFADVPKSFYLYDTFSGIPKEYDTEHTNSPLYAEPKLYERACERFAPYPNIRVVRGVVPEVLHRVSPEKIAFLHLDMNSSKSEIGALEVLFDRVSPGGLIVFDDYGWLAYQAQQLAEDKFVQERGHRILEIPTGQGLLIKR